MKTTVLLVLVAFLLPACQKPHAEADPRRATPQACYEAFRTSWNAGELEPAFALITPRAQQQLVGTQAMMIGLHLGMGGDHDAPLGKALLQLLRQRGFDSYRAFGRRMKEHLGPDENELEGEADDIRNREAFYAMAKDMGPASTFMKEIVRIDRELNPHESFILPYGRIEDIELNGDVAKGWHLMGYWKEAISIDFKRVDGGWKIDQLLTMPVRWPGDQQYRDENGVIQPYSPE